MAPNSVTGSFRGIEVSFAYNGPQIVMSVLNKADKGRKLRVMFQQHPLSGRVNWTSFQLTGLTQDVIVPTEVIESHKLAFYVDDHEPISTYTEKIVEELQLIKEKLPLEPDLNDLEPASEKPLPPETNTLNEEIKENHDNDESTSEAPKPVESESLEQPSADVLEPDENIELNSDNAEQALDTTTYAHKDDNAGRINEDPQHYMKDDNVQSEADAQVATVEQAEEKKSAEGDHQEQEPVSKRKTQVTGHYIPSINNEIQFRIKVPPIPKSANLMQNSYVPSLTSFDSKLKNKNFGFFGNLAGVFGLTVPKKREYIVQQNRNLYDKFHTDLEKLESNYNNGCGISLDNWDLESIDEKQTAVLLLNLMVNEIGEWKKMAKTESSTKDTLAESLKTIEKDLKLTLKQTRGGQAPSPTLFPDRTASSDQDLMNIQKDCDLYLQRFSKKLARLEQKHAEKVKLPAFKKFLVEFIRDKLFPDVAEYCSLSSVQKRLNWFLDLVDYELMPIELGKTKYSPDYHEIKEKRSGDYESDTIIEVVSPGLQSKDGKRVIQNAVVVQAE